MKIIAALLIAFLLVIPGAAVANDGKDELIEAQENLLDAYRCLIGIDLQLVEQGCPGEFNSPTFLPDNWTFFGRDDIRQGNFGLANHGWYIPAIRTGSSLAMDCQNGLIVSRVRFSGQELAINSPTIQVSYTSGDITETGQWIANRINGTVTAVNPEPLNEDFLDHLVASNSRNLDVTATDANGKTVSAQFGLGFSKWAVEWMRHHCDVEFLSSG